MPGCRSGGVAAMLPRYLPIYDGSRLLQSGLDIARLLGHNQFHQLPWGRSQARFISARN